MSLAYLISGEITVHKNYLPAVLRDLEELGIKEPRVLPTKEDLITIDLTHLEWSGHVTPDNIKQFIEKWDTRLESWSISYYDLEVANFQTLGVKKKDAIEITNYVDGFLRETKKKPVKNY